MDLPWWIQWIFIPVVGLLGGADFYIHRNAAAEREKAITAKDVEINTLRAEKDAEIATLHARVGSLSAAFNDYRVNSASLFATVTAVGEVKRELMNSLGRIEDKLDRIVERNDRRDHN